MITGADIKSGYGQKKAKPYNSILPYLRAEAEKKVAKVDYDKEAKKAKKDPEDQKDPEALKTMLKHIHPTATEDELESMVKNM